MFELDCIHVYGQCQESMKKKRWVGVCYTSEIEQQGGVFSNMKLTTVVHCIVIIIKLMIYAFI